MIVGHDELEKDKLSIQFLSVGLFDGGHSITYHFQEEM